MKVLGTSRDGNPIVELEAEDRSKLAGVSFSIEQLRAVEPRSLCLTVKVKATPDAATREVLAGMKSQKERAAALSPAKAVKVRKCAQCGKPMELAHGLKKVCSDECGKKRAARIARERYHYEKAQQNRADEVGKPAAKPEAGRACVDCGAALDNPKKVVCNGCAQKRIRAASGGES